MNSFASKKILIIVGMVLMLFIGIAIGNSFRVNNTDMPVAPYLSQAGLQGNVAADVIKAVPENKSGDSRVKVIRVIDGDTIEIEGGERVRYIGIDTPETVDPRKSVQCFGVEASNKNTELVGGKMMRLEKDITDRDKYNRLLRYVWDNDIFVNLELVKNGFAYSYSYPPDIKYQDLFIKAQQEAVDVRRGLWSSCR